MISSIILTLFGVLVLLFPMLNFAKLAINNQESFARKSGLWEVTLHKDSVSTKESITLLQCSNASTEIDLLFSIVPDQEHCKTPNIKRDSKTSTTIQTQCRINKTQVESTMALTGNFDSVYQGSFSVSYGKPTIKQAIKAVFFEAHWLGECPAEMAPGTMRLSNGIIVNVIEDKQMHEIEK